jgi:hypothetical protein
MDLTMIGSDATSQYNIINQLFFSIVCGLNNKLPV